MQPKIIHQEMIILAGMSFFGDPFDTSSPWSEENQIGALWKRLMAFLQSHPDALHLDLQRSPYYEVHIYGPETETEGMFEVFVGLNLPEITRLPLEMTAKVLPATKYACLTLKGSAIMGDWETELLTWIEENGYQEAHPYHFQLYDERFKGMDRIEESILNVYIPVEAKHESTD
jgi:predicted transcriptional regulator YdeE